MRSTNTDHSSASLTLETIYFLLTENDRTSTYSLRLTSKILDHKISFYVLVNKINITWPEHVTLTEFNLTVSSSQITPNSLKSKGGTFV